jgi:peroxiredoxin
VAGSFYQGNRDTLALEDRFNKMMKRGRVVFLVGVVVWAALVSAADERPRLHPLAKESLDARSGPAVGSQVPFFEVSDMNGKPQIFETLRGPRGLVLAFQRSADWCPYCKTQLVDLNSQLEWFRRGGLNVASITYDSAAILRHFAARQNIRFPMLSDPESKAIRAFDLLNTNIEAGAPQYGIPFPGIYIINEKGIITAKYFDDDHTERYSAAGILTREFRLNGVAKGMIQTPHLTLLYSASDAALTPGRRVNLILQIQAGPKMHVYARGVEHYIPIDWKMAESRSWVSFPASYPPPRILNLPTIKESVPVYDGRFQIVREIAIGQEAEIAPALSADRTLTVDGSFRYQACDDNECYLPKTLPLQWRFQVGKLDLQRVPEELQRKSK